MNKYILSLSLLAVTFGAKAMDSSSTEGSRGSQIFTDEEYDTYCQARELIDLFRKTASETSMSYEHRNELNPYYGVLTQGLILRCCYGLPDHLETPWGEWKFSGSYYSDPEATRNKLLESIKADPIEAGQKGYAPVYSIASVTRTLPLAVHNTDFQMDRANARRAVWQAMQRRYETEKR